MIFKGEVAAIRDVIKRSREQGMQTFDQALFDLYEQDRITLADALRYADSVNDLRLTIKLNSRRGKGDVYAGTENLGIV
jgi:twitching motility protein PilU